MTASATSRIEKFLAERARVRGLDPEQIAGLHEGDEREALLTTSDLRELLDNVALAQAQRDAGNRRIEQMTDELTRLRAEFENERADHYEQLGKLLSENGLLLKERNEARAEVDATPPVFGRCNRRFR